MTGGRGGRRGRDGRGITAQGVGRGRGCRSGVGRNHRAGQGMGRNPYFGPERAGIPFGPLAGQGRKILESLAEDLENVVHAVKAPPAFSGVAQTKSSAPRDRNRETVGKEGLQRIAVVDKEMCSGCRICADICPEDAFVFRNAYAAINPHRCSGCGVCADECPCEAISLLELARAAGP